MNALNNIQSNTIGNLFRITLFGESHSSVLGVIIDGIPAGISLYEQDFIADLTRRKSGKNGTTPRIEEDLPTISSGLENGYTTGESLKISFENTNVQSNDYRPFVDIPRPGHADLVASIKYNLKEVSGGGGIFSGRMTLPIVAAGVVAKKIISAINISAYLVEAAGVKISGDPYENQDFMKLLGEVMSDGDSVGGVVECVCSDVSIGLGEPFFDSLESQIAHLCFSIPGVRGIEFGDGFRAAKMRGSEHNDPYLDSSGSTAKNGAGGINGGISNGNPIVFRLAIKPTSSISKKQASFNFKTGGIEEFSIAGRHDCCFALRVPVVVESMAAIALASMELNSACSPD